MNLTRLVPAVLTVLAASCTQVADPNGDPVGAVLTRKTSIVVSPNGKANTAPDDHISMAITHNHFGTSQPGVVKGLELRVKDASTGAVHSGVIWPKYDIQSPDSCVYCIAPLSNDVFVIRKPTINDEFVYWRLDASPGGGVTLVASAHPDVNTANTGRLWLDRLAAIDPEIPEGHDWGTSSSRF